MNKYEEVLLKHGYVFIFDSEFYKKFKEYTSVKFTTRKIGKFYKLTKYE